MEGAAAVGQMFLFSCPLAVIGSPPPPDLSVPDTEGWHSLCCMCGSDLGSLPCPGLGTPRDFTSLHPDAVRWAALLLQRRILRLRKGVKLVKGRARGRTSQDPCFWPQRYLLSCSLLEGPGSWLGSVKPPDMCAHVHDACRFGFSSSLMSRPSGPVCARRERGLPLRCGRYDTSLSGPVTLGRQPPSL